MFSWDGRLRIGQGKCQSMQPWRLSLWRVRRIECVAQCRVIVPRGWANGNCKWAELCLLCRSGGAVGAYWRFGPNGVAAVGGVIDICSILPGCPSCQQQEAADELDPGCIPTVSTLPLWHFQCMCTWLHDFAVDLAQLWGWMPMLSNSATAQIETWY